MHLDVAAGDLRGDVRGGDVGLLRGEAALPQRPGRHVAHRPRVLDAAHASVGADRHEPAGLVRQPGQHRPAQAREGDDEIDVERPFQLEPEPPVGVLGRERADADAHPGLGEAPAHHRAGRCPEDPERRRLAADQLDRQVESAPAAVVGRHQRQLVEGERPCRAAHGDEGDPVLLARSQRLERLPERQDVARAGEREGARPAPAPTARRGPGAARRSGSAARRGSRALASRAGRPRRRPGSSARRDRG